MTFPSNVSYGPPFNNDEGGWYVVYIKTIPTIFSTFFRFALERTDSYINIWFWPRSCVFEIPPEVVLGFPFVYPPSWVCEIYSIALSLIFINTILQGTPTANFPNTSCNISSHFSEENIIINLTLCKPFILLTLLRIIEYDPP